MAAPVAQHLVDPKTEKMLPAQWAERRTNWMITSAGNSAQCLDDNFGNVAVFGKKCFDSRGETSFLLIIKIKNRDLAQARIGLVAPDYPRIENKDLRSSNQYSWYHTTPGNNLLGSVAGSPTTFNFAIDLKKQVQVDGRMVQLTDENVRDTFDGEIEMRINIRNNLAEFHCPTLWRDNGEKVVHHILHQGKLRLAVCSPGGFGFDLQEILPRLTLKHEIPMGLDLSLKKSDPDTMVAVARERCNDIVDEIRRISPEDGERYNILVAGAFGSGKSSLINTFISLFSNFNDRPKQPALISQKKKHTTRRVSSYRLPRTNVHLIDSIGLTMTGDRLNHSDGLLEELFRGNIHAGFDIRNLDQISGPRVRMERGIPVEETDDEVKQQVDVRGYTTAHLELDHRNHGAFVTRAAPQFGDNLADTFQIVLDFSANHDNYPLVGVVTKLDVGKKDFSVPKIFTEPDICEEYDSIRKEMMLPSVFPARPYTAEDQHRQNAFYNLLAADLMDKMMGEAVQYKERLREYYTDL